jgi:hypothetical protein
MRHIADLATFGCDPADKPFGNNPIGANLQDPIVNRIQIEDR